MMERRSESKRCSRPAQPALRGLGIIGSTEGRFQRLGVRGERVGCVLRRRSDYGSRSRSRIRSKVTSRSRSKSKKAKEETGDGQEDSEVPDLQEETGVDARRCEGPRAILQAVLPQARFAGSSSPVKGHGEDASWDWRRHGCPPAR